VTRTFPQSKSPGAWPGLLCSNILFSSLSLTSPILHQSHDPAHAQHREDDASGIAAVGQDHVHQGRVGDEHVDDEDRYADGRADDLVSGGAVVFDHGRDACPHDRAECAVDRSQDHNREDRAEDFGRPFAENGVREQQIGDRRLRGRLDVSKMAHAKKPYGYRDRKCAGNADRRGIAFLIPAEVFAYPAHIARHQEHRAAAVRQASEQRRRARSEQFELSGLHDLYPLRDAREQPDAGDDREQKEHAHYDRADLSYDVHYAGEAEDRGSDGERDRYGAARPHRDAKLLVHGVPEARDHEQIAACVEYPGERREERADLFADVVFADRLEVDRAFSAGVGIRHEGAEHYDEIDYHHGQHRRDRSPRGEVLHRLLTACRPCPDEIREQSPEESKEHAERHVPVHSFILLIIQN